MSHGLCVNRGAVDSSGRELIAFVEGFAWRQPGEDAVVLFDPARFPAAGPLRGELTAAVETAIRNRLLAGDLVSGFSVTANA